MIDTITARYERRCSGFMVGLIVFFVGAPIAVSMGHNGTWSLASLSPLMVWTFNLWLFGWARMRYAVCVLWTQNQSLNIDGAERFLMGKAVLSQPRGIHGTTSASITQHFSPQGRPCIQATITHAGTPESATLTPQEGAELARILTNGQHAYHLGFLGVKNFTFDLGTHTNHTRMALAHEAATVLNALKSHTTPMNLTPRRSFLERLFPGKMPMGTL